MKNKVVFVTGAGRGSGEAIAKKFLSEGALVAAADLKAPTWDATGNESKLIRISLDVSDEQAVISTIQKINKETSGINVLVNNAGIAKPDAPIIDETIEAFEKMLNVNLKGVFFTVREVVKNLEVNKQPGAIINIASVAGKNGFQGSSLYGATKAAVIGFTRNLAPELGPYDITINAICPGSVDTPMISSVIKNIAARTGMTFEQAKYSMEQSIPMHRLQKPEDVAALVSFLASDGARNINGESINLDGGCVRD